jgi:erythromycin esterase-like protein
VYTGDVAKTIVWAHNSHVGDARATERESRSEWNIGQLLREKLGHAGVTFNIGFTTFTGSVSAAHSWGGERQTMQVRPALPDSYEQVMHEIAFRTGPEDEPMSDFLIMLRQDGAGSAASASASGPASAPRDTAIRLLRHPSRLERAIGVQYVPATERQSHYFHADLPAQFDALIHVDVSNALRAILPPRVEQRMEREAAGRGEEPAPLPVNMELEADE